MTKSRRSPGRWVAVSLLALACSGGGDAGPSGPVATNLLKASGDDQSGLPGAALPQPLEVRITDAGGVGMGGLAVTFTTTAGTLNPPSTTTDTQGRARTLLTLPNQAATVTITATAQGLPSVSFTARSVPLGITISTQFLPAARSNVAYERTLAASGGSPSASLSYTVTSGSLPPGMTLASDGKITGTASAAGSFPVTIRVSDGQSSETSRAFTLNVCDPTPAMAIGEVRTLQVSSRGSCGFFLPAGAANARYRVTVARTDNQPNGNDLSNVSFVTSGNGVTTTTVAEAAPERSAPLARRPVAIPGFERIARRLDASRREHLQQMADGEALARQLGTEGVLRPRAPRLGAPEAAAPLPDKIRLDPGTSSVCNTTTPAVTALKLAENDWLAIYQDSAQNSILATKVSPQEGAKVIELATTYGKQVIDRYFGGVADIDGNGKVIVFVTPAIGDALGKVWTGNFYRKADCPASNEGEYVLLDWEAVKGILATSNQHWGQYILVHELKHVSSLYQRLLRTGSGVVDPRRQADFNPLWMEEGGAELAAEAAARYAWSQVGGPAMNVAVTETSFRLPNDQADVRTENFAVFWMLYGAQEALAFQPNSVVAQPPGAPSSYVYSSGWVFQRWMADAFGNAAAGPFADADFWKRLNDQTTPSGILGIETVTGRSWAQLMEDFSLAAAAHGWGGITVPRRFTSYDFVSAIEMWCYAVDPVDLVQSQCGGEAGPPGVFPWPVTTDSQGLSEAKSFSDGLVEGTAGPSGIRVHELLSNGTGRGAEINVEVTAPVRITVIRLR